ncbi:MAG: type II toxin-antitoxin system VapC family toxin [Gammaproteobacteria bacterium]
MKLPDTNVLLNAVNERLPQHSIAVNWLAEAYASPTGLGFAWVALLGFMRLATPQGILEKPLSVDQALRLVHDWLAHPRAQILHPTERHEPLLGRLLRTAGRDRIGLSTTLRRPTSIPASPARPPAGLYPVVPST